MDGRSFADAESAVSGSHKPRLSKLLLVELPGVVAPTSGRVFCGLLVQNVCVQTVQDLLIGAASGSGLVVLLRAPTRVGLVSGQEAHPLPAEVSAIEKS